MSASTALASRPEILGDKALAKVQAWSGLAFATFLVLHVGNLVAALFGVEAYDRFMRVARFYYQFPLVEVVCVLAAAFVHMAAGAARILRRRRLLGRSASRRRGRNNDAKPSLRVRLHRYSGYVLMAAFAGHVAATRLPSLTGEQVDFTFLNFSLTYAGVFFFPYYMIFAASGLYHLGHGTLAALRIVGARLPRGLTSARSRVFTAWAVAGAVIAVTGVLALGGVLYEVDQSRAAEWRAYFENILPAGWAPW